MSARGGGRDWPAGSAVRMRGGSAPAPREGRCDGNANGQARVAAGGDEQGRRQSEDHAL
jgi:hypothetical protein